MVNRVIENILGISSKSENKEGETKNIEIKENKIDIETNKIEDKKDTDLYEIKEEIKI